MAAGSSRRVSRARLEFRPGRRPPGRPIQAAAQRRTDLHGVLQRAALSRKRGLEKFETEQIGRFIVASADCGDDCGTILLFARLPWGGLVRPIEAFKG